MISNGPFLTRDTFIDHGIHEVAEIFHWPNFNGCHFRHPYQGVGRAPLR